MPDRCCSDRGFFGPCGSAQTIPQMHRGKDQPRVCRKGMVRQAQVLGTECVSDAEPRSHVQTPDELHANTGVHTQRKLIVARGELRALQANTRPRVRGVEPDEPPALFSEGKVLPFETVAVERHIELGLSMHELRHVQTKHAQVDSHRIPSESNVKREAVEQVRAGIELEIGMTPGLGRGVSHSGRVVAKYSAHSVWQIARICPETR